MLCEICRKNPVKVKIVKMINGKKEEKNLCEKCAKKYENIEVKAIKRNEENEISRLLKDKKNMDKILEEMKNKVCLTCGLDIKGFISTGRVGCENCYEEFKNTIEFVIGRIQTIEGQGTDDEKEKMKAQKNKENNQKRIDQEIKKLQRKLVRKVKNENFEEAAKIRDEISSMQEGLDG